jgi:hypothetical protein
MINSLLRYLTYILLLMVMVGCGDQIHELVNGVEKDSKIAPSGLSRVFIWVPENGGIGVSQSYQIWMQSLQGDKPKQLILEADKTNGFELEWKPKDELQICYETAQITMFKNYFVAGEEDWPVLYTADIVLKKVDKLADCGR